MKRVNIAAAWQNNVATRAEEESLYRRRNVNTSQRFTSFNSLFSRLLGNEYSDIRYYSRRKDNTEELKKIPVLRSFYR
jgi:hypothetical protein